MNRLVNLHVEAVRDDSITLAPNSDRQYLMGVYGLALVAGRRALLDKLPSSVISAVTSGDDTALHDYLQEIEPDIYVPGPGAFLSIIGAQYQRPYVQPEQLLVATVGARLTRVSSVFRTLIR